MLLIHLPFTQGLTGFEREQQVCHVCKVVLFSGGGLQFPENVDDDPVAIPARQLQIVDPVRSDDLGARGVFENVQNGYVLLLFLLWRLLAVGAPRSLDQRHGAHLVQAALALLIRAYDTLREFRM